ncbi:MAG: hypothetical protein KAX19_03690 [Candidatus Brocadiae bacterium]|nr:hypothetical protein [Candidatus Brocadiia bacterium]
MALGYMLPESLLTSCTGDSLVVPHEELGVFLEDVFGDALGHCNDGAVVAVLPAVLEAGALPLPLTGFQGRKHIFAEVCLMAG